MKFTEGYWEKNERANASYAMQAFTAEAIPGGMRIVSPFRQITDRGGALDVGTITTEFISVRKDIISVRSYHYEGYVKGEPITFEESRSFSLQTFQVVRKAGPAVFHENNLALYPGNLVKAQITKETRSIAFCIQKETGVATAVLKLDQMGDDLVHQAFTLVLGRNSHAAQCVGKTGAGCHKIVIIIEQSDAVIEVFVPLDSFFF